MYRFFKRINNKQIVVSCSVSDGIELLRITLEDALLHMQPVCIVCTYMHVRLCVYGSFIHLLRECEFISAKSNAVCILFQ